MPIREKQLRQELRNEAKELRKEEERHHAKKEKKEKEICKAQQFFEAYMRRQEHYRDLPLRMYWTVCTKQTFMPRVDSQYPLVINKLDILDTLNLTTLIVSKIMLPLDQVICREIIMKGMILIIPAKSEDVTARND
jgi:hypothetical protein